MSSKRKSELLAEDSILVNFTDTTIKHSRMSGLEPVQDVESLASTPQDLEVPLLTLPTEVIEHIASFLCHPQSWSSIISLRYQDITLSPKELLSFSCKPHFITRSCRRVTIERDWEYIDISEEQTEHLRGHFEALEHLNLSCDGTRADLFRCFGGKKLRSLKLNCHRMYDGDGGYQGIMDDRLIIDLLPTSLERVEFDLWNVSISREVALQLARCQKLVHLTIDSESIDTVLLHRWPTLTSLKIYDYHFYGNAGPHDTFSSFAALHPDIVELSWDNGILPRGDYFPRLQVLRVRGEECLCNMIEPMSDGRQRPLRIIRCDDEPWSEMEDRFRYVKTLSQLKCIAGIPLGDSFLRSLPANLESLELICTQPVAQLIGPPYPTAKALHLRCINDLDDHVTSSDLCCWMPSRIASHRLSIDPKMKIVRMFVSKSGREEWGLTFNRESCVWWKGERTVGKINWNTATSSCRKSECITMGDCDGDCGSCDCDCSPCDCSGCGCGSCDCSPCDCSPCDCGCHHHGFCGCCDCGDGQANHNHSHSISVADNINYPLQTNIMVTDAIEEQRDEKKKQHHHHHTTATAYNQCLLCGRKVHETDSTYCSQCASKIGAPAAPRDIPSQTIAGPKPKVMYEGQQIPPYASPSPSVLPPSFADTSHETTLQSKQPEDSTMDFK
ncbi:hypothetical protein PROFUN_10708 [Planoprotostelium fungivorum]|uniref:Uncharacterized protein n=1 Tax=Planoprotostelium fungivorum TaxID=1890364 RepID=A0A2P6N9M5_9EUKA|nr:hypothetical protein PROFUN_10708 [Planoprotostelium fungivorum]